MSRPIKFRAWHTKMEQMCGWDDIQMALKQRGGGRLAFPEKTPVTQSMGFISQIDLKVEIVFAEQIFDHPDIILMQFTGLYDKNGKGIWEGDIVILGSHKTLTAVIEWENCGFVQRWVHENLRTKIGMPAYHNKMEPIFDNSHISLEVLGNIYENPEILKLRGGVST